MISYDANERRYRFQPYTEWAEIALVLPLPTPRGERWGATCSTGSTNTICTENSGTPCHSNPLGLPTVRPSVRNQVRACADEWSTHLPRWFDCALIGALVGIAAGFYLSRVAPCAEPASGQLQKSCWRSRLLRHRHRHWRGTWLTRGPPRSPAKGNLSKFDARVV